METMLAFGHIPRAGDRRLTPCWLPPARHSVQADRAKMARAGILFQRRLKFILVYHPNN